MSSFFTSFPTIGYKFGSESSVSAFHDLAVYVDIISSLKDQTTAYEYFNIKDNDRPDNISNLLYGTPNYYWTFYIHNDGLKRSGWPLPYLDLQELIKKRYPNRTIVLRKILKDDFAVGMNVYGVTSASGGVIIARNLELGQIVVKPTNNKTFIAGEVLQSNVGLDGLADGSGQPVTNHNIHSTTLEYLSAHHYEDTSGNYVDIDPVNGPGASLVEVTYQERMRKKNDSLRRMKFFKPNIVTEIVKKFEDELK